jgi:hypothetical protein
MVSGTDRCCGAPPGPNASIMTRRPPQQGAWDREDTRLVRSVGGLGVGWGCGGHEEFADAGDVGGAIAIGEEAVVADAVLAFGKHVDQEAANELVGRERHGLVAAGPVDPVVLDPEGDAVRVGPDQAAVGDRDAVGVAAEIRIALLKVERSE